MEGAFLLPVDAGQASSAGKSVSHPSGAIFPLQVKVEVSSDRDDKHLAVLQRAV